MASLLYLNVLTNFVSLREPDKFDELRREKSPGLSVGETSIKYLKNNLPVSGVFFGSEVILGKRISDSRTFW